MRSLFRRRHAICLAVSSVAVAARVFGDDPEVKYNEPTLNGFSPQVVVGVTDEQNHNDDVIGYGVASSNPGGFNLPGPTDGNPNPAQLFTIATLDSGAQAHIFNFATATALNFESRGRDGLETQPVEGVNGAEEFPITDGVGIYMTGFNNASVVGQALNVTPGTLQGHWNVPVLTMTPDDELPNIIGSPILSQYKVTIENHLPQHLTVGSTTYRSPRVSLGALALGSDALPAGYSKMTLKTSDVGPPDQPYYINFNFSGADNPTSPGAWSSLLTDGGIGKGVDLSDGGNSIPGQNFIFDTGAQVSLISRDTAAAIGILQDQVDNHPDFKVTVGGVGGQSELPGFYIDSLKLHTQGGTITFNHVPVIVSDAADPRDPGSAVPGILGMNLFGDRDIILNANVNSTSGVYFAIGPQWMWKSNGGGTWSNSANWDVALPGGIDTQANFFSAITSSATVNVDGAGVTVGSIAFDNANSYTINGATITLSVSTLGAQINVNSGSHTINAPIVMANDTDITVWPSASKLLISSNISSAGKIIGKYGLGTAEVKNIVAGELDVLEGTMAITSDGTSTGASKINKLAFPKIQGREGDPIQGKLNLKNNAMVIDYTGASPLTDISGWVKSGYAGGSWSGTGIVSSTAATIMADGLNPHKTAIGYAEASSVGSPGSLLGQSVDGTSILLRYTYLGDANVDGVVNLLDLGRLAANFGKTNKLWSDADFTFNGTIDTLDFNFLAANYGLTMVAAAPLPGALVPEPAAMALCVSVLPFLLQRRRR